MSVFNHLWRLLPLICVIFAFLIARFNFVSFLDIELLRLMPYLLACVLVGFASMFNRMRFIAPILIALFTYHFIRERLQIPLSHQTVMAMFTGLNLLFCVQLICASVLPEKGLFSRFGSAVLAFFLIGDILLWFYGRSYFRWIG